VAPPGEATIGANLSLSCTVPDGRPVARVEWRRAGVPFEGVGVDETEEAGSSEGRRTLVSTLVFAPQAADDGVVYRCEAKQPALGPEGLAQEVGDKHHLITSPP
jgi:hypothetical protein